MPRKVRVNKDNTDGRLLLDPTSSLNEYFMCVCKRRFKFKKLLIKHVSQCKSNKKVICRWCNLEFANRGNLINHSHYMHGDKNSGSKMINDVDIMRPPSTTVVPKRPTIKPQFKCDVCDAKFTAKWQIKFHIRRNHFNLWAHIPHANAKQVNQIWFEKVLNTNQVMEIKKVGVNKLIMKPTPPKEDLEIHEINNRIDLRNQYPLTRKHKKEKCKICGNMYMKYDLKKHMDEIHFRVAKHKCNNCNRSFKRSYVYLQHVCNKKRKPRVTGVKHNQSSSIRIASVGTLTSEVVN